MFSSSLILRLVVFMLISKAFWTFTTCNTRKYHRIRNSLSLNKHRYISTGNTLMKCASKCLGMEKCNYLMIRQNRRCHVLQGVKKLDRNWGISPKRIWPQRLRAATATAELKPGGASMVSWGQSGLDITLSTLALNITGGKLHISDYDQYHRDVVTTRQTGTTPVSTTVLSNKLKSKKKSKRFSTLSSRHVSVPSQDTPSHVTSQSRDPSIASSNSKQKAKLRSRKGHCSNGYTYHKYKPKSAKDKRTADPKCLKLHNSHSVSWPRAKRLCSKEGGHLVVTNEKMNFKVVKQYMKYKSGLGSGLQNMFGCRAWIGLKDNTWVDGSKKTFQNLQNRRVLEGCVSIQMRGKLRWLYQPCTEKNFFICEMPVSFE